MLIVNRLIAKKGGGRVRVMVFNALSTIFQYIVVVNFIGGGNECTEKTSNLPQVTDKLYHIMFY
jgi:hypothetical protein